MGQFYIGSHRRLPVYRVPRRIAAGLLFLGALVSSVAAAGTMEPLQCIDHLLEELARCKDYQYQLTTFERKGDKEEERSYRLYAKDGRMVRIKVTAGRGKGSEAAVDSRGRIRGRKGGMLKPFDQAIKPDDHRIRSLRGTAFWEGAAHNYLKALRERMRQPGVRCEIESAPEQPGYLLLVVRRPGDVREQYWIDNGRMRLMKGEVYEAGQLVERFVIRDVRENVGLKDGFFSF